VSGLLTAAVLCWFEAWGLVGLRASVLSGLGFTGLAATATVALIGAGYVLPCVASWLMWPSLVLVIVWGRRVARSGTASA
jgi:hypothetical protein